jgi:hypothetical protein
LANGHGDGYRAAGRDPGLDLEVPKHLRALEVRAEHDAASRQGEPDQHECQEVPAKVRAQSVAMIASMRF